MQDDFRVVLGNRVEAVNLSADSAWTRLREVPWVEISAQLREELLPVIARVLDGDPAERALDRFLRSHRDLTFDQRRASAEAVFGVGLWRRRLTALLHGAPATPAALLDTLISHPNEPLDRLADRASLPDWLERVLLEELQDQADAFANAINLPGPVCLRVQRTAIDDAFLASLTGARRCQLSPLGIILPGRPNILGLPAYQRGLLEPQDEGSQLIGLLLDAQPSETLLDFCAGAGGKTLLLADVTHDRATIHAHDPSRERLSRLRQRAARAGFTSIRIDSLPTTPCDRVLVDVPCSELGALRRGPDLRWRIDPSTLSTFPALQHSILASAARHVRPGGRLVYATCTIRRAENEDIALHFEHTHPSFHRHPSPLLPTPDGFFRALPHLHGTDGFFAAIWTRSP
jgi:16S rRNA (cytosine967-C5)-methyltransferase